MKLYYKPEFLGFNPQQNDTEVTDSDNNVLYTVSGKKTAFGFERTINDSSGSEAASIKQKTSLFALKFIINVKGKQYTFLLKHRLNGDLYFKTDDNNWSSTGNLRDDSYTIISQTGSEVTVNKADINGSDNTNANLKDMIVNAYAKRTSAVREISFGSDINATEILALTMACDMAVAADNTISN